MKIFKILKKMFLIGLASIAGIFLLLLLVLLILSPGRMKPYKDETGKVIPGSISEKTFINIGGIRQGMIIKSKNDKNPVLLYLHGGVPDYYLTKKYPTGLEEMFTVVYWEQRGAGLSYRNEIPAETMTLDQMITDTKEVTNYLRKRFKQDKIYLLGRSGGTFIGIFTIAKSPELYHAYIGVGQMTDQLTSERLAYKYMVETYSETGNNKMVNNLKASPVTDHIPQAYLKLRDPAMHAIGIGTTRDMKSVFTGMFTPSLMSKEYTLKEKYNLWKGKSKAGVHPLWDTILKTDIAKEVTEVDIPVYFFHGIFDYTVSYHLSKAFFDNLKAPVKGFYTFRESAHSPLFEEPEKVKQIIRADILTGKNSLADKNDY